MKGLDKIQEEAKILVDTLWNLELDSMNAICNKFKESGLSLESNDFYKSLDKYSFELCDRWDSDIKGYVNHKFEDYNNSQRYSIFRNNASAQRAHDIILNLLVPNDNYRERNLNRMKDNFYTNNTMKLNRALAKHITNEMTATEINVTTGGIGCEVIAIIDGDKVFKTKGTLCGGNIQCYHYRYFSSITNK